MNASPHPAPPTVLLATHALQPGGETGGDLLLTALADVGVDARWAVWDDPQIDWAGADLVVVRSTWDYHRRTEEFLAWVRRTQSRTRVLNGAEVFAWNADKSYLLDLAPRVPVVPTQLLDETGLVSGLVAGLAEHGTVVVKPRTGAGGVGLVVVADLADPRLEGLVTGPWVLQPLVDSVRTQGETSVYVFAGEAVSQVDKRPAGGGEVRVHEVYGGSSRGVPLTADTAAAARAAVLAATELLGGTRADVDLAYARVDLVRWDDAWAVGELELIEPGLYLDVEPGNAARFARLVAARC